MKPADMLRTAGSWAAAAIAFVWRIVARGCGQLGRQTQVRVAQTEGQRLASRKQDRFLEMGCIVYEMYQKDRVRSERLREICQQIAAMDDAIATAEKRVEALRDVRPRRR